MNIILFTVDELDSSLDRQDDRARHIIEILKLREGSKFDAGVPNGNIGKATILAISGDAIELDFDLNETCPPLHPIELIVGLPRPQTARDILRDATAIGVRRMHFVQTDKGEDSYGRSKIWQDGAYRSYLLQGAQTAFSTRIPEVSVYPALSDALFQNQGPDSLRVVLDNYEATESLSQSCRSTRMRSSAILAVGSERGWSARERNAFREAGYAIASIGDRVLRAETAVIAGVSILLSEMSCM